MRIEHVAIWTHDLERLRAFYETYFGASASTRYHSPDHQFESVFFALCKGRGWS